MLDAIIVGQGIAGTSLAFRMMDAGYEILVYDKGSGITSSRVAAGLINPVTGRKMVKSWMIDELLPEAVAMYRRMEDDLGISCLHPVPMYRMLASVREQNDWLAKASERGYENYAGGLLRPAWDFLETPHGVGEVKQAYWVDLPALLDAMAFKLREKGSLVEEDFRYDELDLNGDLKYDGRTTRRVIFCEGFRGKSNPFFDTGPLSNTKGEVMTIRSEGMKALDGVLNRNGFVLPVGDGLFRVGATFAWDDDSLEPTEAGRRDLCTRLEDLSGASYKVEVHLAGQRPTVEDRRPLVGRSKIDDRLYFFNGLGTKGASLAPYFSGRLLAYMIDGNSLPPEVGLDRFQDQR